MRPYSLATAAVVIILTGCAQADKQPDDQLVKAEEQKNEGGVAQQPMTGKIGGADWTFARGFAYVPDWAPDKIVIGLFDFKGPVGCRRLPDGDIVHNFASEDAANAEQDEASVTIPKTVIAPFTFKKDAPGTEDEFDADISNYKEDGSGGNSDGAARLEITEATHEKVSGALRIRAVSGDEVEGTFTATFCTDGWK